MTYQITASDLSDLRGELRTLNHRSSRLEEDLRSFRQSHDAHLKELAAERDRRASRRLYGFLVLSGLIWLVNFILMFIPHK